MLKTAIVLFQCLDVDMEYGFEYQGSSPREVITPNTERAFVALTQAINAYMGTMCVGSIVSGSVSLQEIIMLFFFLESYVLYYNGK